MKAILSLLLAGGMAAGCTTLSDTTPYNYRGHLSETSDRELCDVIPYYNAFDSQWSQRVYIELHAGEYSVKVK